MATDISIIFYGLLREVHCQINLDKKATSRLVSDRPVTRGGVRGAFAPPAPQAPKVCILILNIQVKECSRLN